MIEEKVVSFGYEYYRVCLDSETGDFIFTDHVLENPATKDEYIEYINNGDYIP